MSEVVERKKLFDGPRVAVKLPMSAHKGSVPGTDVMFWQYPIAYRGGVLNVHLHGEADRRGKTLVCDMQVWYKRFKNGRWFLYVDLYEAPSDVLAEHRFVVASKGQHVWPQTAQAEQLMSTNKQAHLIIMQYGEKLVDAKDVPGLQQDTQLQRLIGQGWSIEGDASGRSITLKRNHPKKGMKTMVHKRAVATMRVAVA